MPILKIGFGGGCHWCTESVFQSLKGVQNVVQGWIASENENDSFSEAVIVHFDPDLVDLRVLIEIHLNTHSSTSSHARRGKYRSGIYTFEQTQYNAAVKIKMSFQEAFNNELITEVYRFKEFKPSPDQYQDYYLKNPEKPFCQRYISPKLKWVEKQFPSRIKMNTFAGAIKKQ
jgi:peptide-methionine (S)-S-oxide reductase